MKCINCNTNSLYRERTNSRCKSCGHEFAFEPKGMNPKVTDSFYAKIISEISQNRTIFYTQKQFNYYVDKALKKRQNKYYLGVLIGVSLFFALWFPGFFGGIFSTILGSQSFLLAFTLYLTLLIIILIRQTKSATIGSKNRNISKKILLVIGLITLVIGGYIYLIVFQSFFYFVWTTLLGMTGVYFGFTQLRNQSPITQTFLFPLSKQSEWQGKWNRINPNLAINPLQLPSRRETSLPNINFTDYSFDRLLVCQKDDIAHFLIANNFHLENNCAVVSYNGYPENGFQTILEMAKQNPALTVYTLHDCSQQGILLPYHLKTRENWFLNQSISLQDIGLSYQQAMKFPNTFWIKDDAINISSLPLEVRQLLSEETLNLLENGYYIELESFTPKSLLKILKKSLNRIESSDISSTSDWSTTNDNTTTALVFFSADSFG